MKKIFIKHKVLITLFIVFLLAFALRIYHLATLPFNFHEDEVLVGYIGRFILQNGIDLYGNHWPLLYFNKFGDYYIIGPMYLSGLSTVLFGVNEFAVRFPAAFFGSLAVFPMFYLTQYLFKNRKVAIYAAFFTAIAPWHLVLSRTSVEGVIGSTMLLAGICLLLFSYEKMSIRYFIGSTLVFLLTYFVYHPFRMYAPIILLVFTFIFAIRKKRLFFITSLMVAVLFFALTLYIGTTPWGKGRFLQTSIFSPLSGVSIQIQESIYAVGPNQVLLARIFHNKVIGYSREFVKQYLSYFSPEFLFIRSGIPTGRFTVPQQGLLYFTFLFCLIICFIPLKNNQVKINTRALRIFLLLVIIAPIPASFTVLDSPNIHRALFLCFMLIVFIAYGFYKTSLIYYKKITLTIVFSLLLFGEFLYFWHQYTYQSDLYNSLYRNDATKQLITYLKENEKKYKIIMLPSLGNIPIYYLFYTKNLSKIYAKQFKLDAKIHHIRNLVFFDTDCPSNLKNIIIPPNALIVESYNCANIKKLHLIKRITGKNELLGYKIFYGKEKN